MTTNEQEITEEKRKYFPGHIDSAFDLASGGMGIHLHAVDRFGEGRELPNWAKNSLPQFASNYLVNPYVFGWTWREGMDTFFKEYRPFATSPYSDSHVKLFWETHDEYDRLQRVQLRLLLGGEEGLSTTNPETPITQDEFDALVYRAKKQGLIVCDATDLPVESAEDEFSLAINLTKAGFRIPDKFYSSLDAIKFSERFRDPMLRAATHKLGCMLALTDQLTYDAKALGVPISPNYKPTPETEKWEASWARLFGEPMPTVEGLYRQAHAVFVKYSNPNDQLVTYLLTLRTLPQLG